MGDSEWGGHVQTFKTRTLLVQKSRYVSDWALSWCLAASPSTRMYPLPRT